MIFITCVVSSNEWIKLHEQAGRSWPGEQLSRGEVMRRLSPIGCDRMPKKMSEESKAAAQEFRESLDPNHPAFRGALPVAK